MNKQVMVPCTSGKCGVKSHILGSAEQLSCGTSAARVGSAKISASVPTLNQSEQAVAVQEFRSVVALQKEAALRLQEASAPAPQETNPLKRLFGKKDDPQARKAEAEHVYRERKYDEAVQSSFRHMLETAKSARPSIPGGEYVSPMRNENGTTAFSNINYVNDERGIVVTALSGTGETYQISYRSDSIAFKHEFIGYSVPMFGGDRYDWKTAAYPREADGYYNESDHKACHKMIDLLAHCQDERNWEG